MSTVTIHSSHRSAGSTANFTVSVGDHLQGTYALDSLQILHSFYNVSHHNYKLAVRNAGSTWLTLELAHGQYTMETLGAAVQTLLTNEAGLSGAWLVTIHETQQTLRITRDSGEQFEVDPEASLSILGELGFSEATSSATVGGVITMESQGIVDPMFPLNVFVDIKQARGEVMTSSNDQKQYCIQVPMNEGYLSLVALSGRDYPRRMHFNSPAKQLNICLYDINDQEISNNGVEWSFTLRRV